MVQDIALCKPDMRKNKRIACLSKIGRQRYIKKREPRNPQPSQKRFKGIKYRYSLGTIAMENGCISYKSLANVWLRAFDGRVWKPCIQLNYLHCEQSDDNCESQKPNTWTLSSNLIAYHCSIWIPEIAISRGACNRCRYSFPMTYHDIATLDEL